MATHVYTTGYGGHSVEDITELMVRFRARLVDIRFNPMSSRPEFNLKELRDRFGTNYLHLGAWGNENYKGGPIKIKDWEQGLRVLDIIRLPVLLMCSCREFETCHRYQVAERLLKERRICCLEVSLRPVESPAPNLFDQMAESARPEGALVG